jgi:hypothetical protein
LSREVRQPARRAEAVMGPSAEPDRQYRSCSECGRDCEPEAFYAGPGLTLAFSCQEHGVHSVLDPFDGSRQGALRGLLSRPLLSIERKTAQPRSLDRVDAISSNFVVLIGVW